MARPICQVPGVEDRAAEEGWHIPETLVFLPDSDGGVIDMELLPIAEHQDGGFVEVAGCETFYYRLRARQSLFRIRAMHGGSRKR